MLIGFRVIVAKNDAFHRSFKAKKEVNGCLQENLCAAVFREAKDAGADGWHGQAAQIVEMS